MRGGRKLEMRQRREALLGASKHKPLACKEGSGSGVSLRAGQVLQGEHTRKLARPVRRVGVQMLRRHKLSSRGNDTTHHPIIVRVYNWCYLRVA